MGEVWLEVEPHECWPPDDRGPPWAAVGIGSTLASATRCLRAVGGCMSLLIMKAKGRLPSSANGGAWGKRHNVYTHVCTHGMGRCLWWPR